MNKHCIMQISSFYKSDASNLSIWPTEFRTSYKCVVNWSKYCFYWIVCNIYSHQAFLAVLLCFFVSYHWLLVITWSVMNCIFILSCMYFLWNDFYINHCCCDILVFNPHSVKDLGGIFGKTLLNRIEITLKYKTITKSYMHLGTRIIR